MNSQPVSISTIRFHREMMLTNAFPKHILLTYILLSEINVTSKSEGEIYFLLSKNNQPSKLLLSHGKVSSYFFPIVH